MAEAESSRRAAAGAVPRGGWLPAAAAGHVIIQRCWADDPKERLSLDDFVGALRTWQAEEERKKRHGGTCTGRGERTNFPLSLFYGHEQLLFRSAFSFLRNPL